VKGYINKLVRGVKTVLKLEANYPINTLKSGSDYWTEFSLDNAQFSICVSKDANIYEVTIYDSDCGSVDVENPCVVYNGQWLTDFLTQP